jgi:hypothetical protein
MESGGIAVADEVSISIDLELIENTKPQSRLRIDDPHLCGRCSGVESRSEYWKDLFQHFSIQRECLGHAGDRKAAFFLRTGVGQL